MDYQELLRKYLAKDHPEQLTGRDAIVLTLFCIWLENNAAEQSVRLTAFGLHEAKMSLYQKLKNLLNEHRREVVVTCEEDCICFDLEEMLYCYYLKGLEQANTVLQADKSQSPVLEDESGEDIIPF